MKKLLLISMAFLIIASVNAQKKSNLLIEGGVFSYSMRSSYFTDKGESYTTPTASIIYSYAPRGKFAFGFGIEAGEFPKGQVFDAMQYDATLAPVLDFRYYLKTKKNVFFPLFQVGYRLYSDHNTFSNSQAEVISDFSAIAQFSIGAGYSRSILKNGGGPFIQVKFEDQMYNSKIQTTTRTEPVTKASTNTNISLIGVAATLGFRL